MSFTELLAATAAEAVLCTADRAAIRASNQTLCGEHDPLHDLACKIGKLRKDEAPEKQQEDDESDDAIQAIHIHVSSLLCIMQQKEPFHR